LRARSGSVNYSFSYKNVAGLTQHSEFIAFDDDRAAIAHGKLDADANAIVEIWKNDNLLLRLTRGANQ